MSDLNNTLKAIVYGLEDNLYPRSKMMELIRTEVEKALSGTLADRDTMLTALNTAVATGYGLLDTRTKIPGKLPVYIASGNATAINVAFTAAVFDAAVAALEIELPEE